MYHIKDTQIEFILSDISARGVEMESLQQNLLDHICCIIEQELEENGDFELFYQQTILRFFKSDLWEIEEETLRLLTFENYYTMKKIMLLSGAISTAALSIGIIFKFMHWPGANALIVVGILLASFVFLPLTFTLRFKEKQNLRDKGIIVIGSLSAILISLHVLFKIMHWPFANMLGTLSFFIVLLVFLPVYFFSGIRNPETKTNTIVSSFLILLGCGLLLTLFRTPRNTMMQNRLISESYLRTEQLIKNEAKIISAKKDTLKGFEKIEEIGNAILFECYQLKTNILEYETGQRVLDSTYVKNDILLAESPVYDYFKNDEALMAQITKLSNLLNDYDNACLKANFNVEIVPFKQAIHNLNSEKVLTALLSLSQLQHFVLQNKLNKMLE
jgi:hypothetical protein